MITSTSQNTYKVHTCTCIFTSNTVGSVLYIARATWKIRGV